MFAHEQRLFNDSQARCRLSVCVHGTVVTVTHLQHLCDSLRLLKTTYPRPGLQAYNINCTTYKWSVFC